MHLLENLALLAADPHAHAGSKAGELGALALAGVYEVTKNSGVAFAAGMEVGWNPTDRKAVAAGAAGSVKIGHAVALTGASDPTAFVRLCQGLS